MSCAVSPLFLSVLTLLVPPARTVVQPGPAAGLPVRVEVEPAVPAAGEEADKGPLTGSITAGLSASFGNTEVTKVNFNASAVYVLDEKNRLSGQFDWLFAEEKDQATKVNTVSQRRIRGAGQYDHLWTKRVYGFLRVDAINDGQQNLVLRLIPSAGLGYQLITADDEKLAVEVGLALTHEDFKRASPDDYAAVRLAGKYFRQLTEDLKLTASAEWLPSAGNTDDQVVLGMVEGAFAIRKGFVTTLRWEFDYDNTPGAGLDRLDHRIIWGLGYTF